MFYPGKSILSIGGFGCNLRCPFCQNSDISLEFGTAPQGAAHYTPEQIAACAEKAVPGGNIGAAYTYNEPLIGYEFVYDCAILLHNMGLRNVLVTNGYINREPLERLLPFIDAMNIDLKGLSEDFYRKLGGSLGPVKEAIALAHQRCHIEITMLIIPGENDSNDEVAALAGWIASLNPDIPLHLSRFFPRYKYADKKPTSPETVRRLREIAKTHLNHVYMGNI
jgi:pyruvate formate lyase activating enzyme